MAQPNETRLTVREREVIRRHEYGELNPLRTVDDRLEALVELVMVLRGQLELHEMLLDVLLHAGIDRLVMA